ncbi:MAG: hypothetical protein K8R90_05210 [Candidatus Cloacimonetes bacterium]|nr:hypothetical protein [Candidatus Cloacimonadota bacterium]
MNNYPEHDSGLLTLAGSGSPVVGNAVKITGEDACQPVGDADTIFGLAKSVDTDNYVGVQFNGVITYTYSGDAPTVGHRELIGAASGAIRLATGEEVGRMGHVLGVDTDDNLVAVIF